MVTDCGHEKLQSSSQQNNFYLSQRQSFINVNCVCFTCSDPWFSPCRIEIFYFSLGLELEGLWDLNCQCFLQNIPRLNPKSLCNEFVVKACVLLIAIDLSDGNFKPGRSLNAFRQQQVNTSTRFLFHPSLLTFIIHTLHYNTTLTYTLLDIFSYLIISITL